MKAVVYHEPYEVSVEDVDDPNIEDPTDVIIKVSSSAICGSDLHMYEGRTGVDTVPFSATRIWALSSMWGPA